MGEGTGCEAYDEEEANREGDHEDLASFNPPRRAHHEGNLTRLVKKKGHGPPVQNLGKRHSCTAVTISSV